MHAIFCLKYKIEFKKDIKITFFEHTEIIQLNFPL